MGKKYILIDGVKHYIEDDDDKDKKPEGADEEKNDEGAEGEDEKITDEAKSLAKDIIGKITANLDQTTAIKELNEKVEKLLANNSSVDPKLKALLNGKEINSDELTKEEKIMGFYYAAMTFNDHALKGLSEGADGAGGYLVPAEFRAEIIKELDDVAIVRQVARVVPMKRRTLEVPAVVSGVQAYWTEEGAVKSTTSAHFEKPTLTARKLAAILYATDELIEDSDSFDVVQLVISLFATRIAQLEDDAFAQGNGTTAPTGLSTARAAATIASLTVTGENLSYDHIIDLEYTLGKQYRKNAVYLAHSHNVRDLRKLKDNNGAYLWQPAPAQGQPATLNGKPFYEFDSLPEKQIYFGDFKFGYWWGDRKRISVLLSQHTDEAFTKDRTAIRIVERVAGNVVWGNAIKCLYNFN